MPPNPDPHNGTSSIIFTAPSRPDRDDHVSKSFGREAGFTVGEVVLPLPLEHINILFTHLLALLTMLLHQRRPNIGAEVLHESLPPQTQGLRVVRANILDGLGNQLRRVSFGARPSAYSIEELRGGGQVAAGEDVAPDEVVAFAVARVPRLRDGDALEDCHATFAFEKVVYAAEVGFRGTLRLQLPASRSETTLSYFASSFGTGRER